MCQCGCSSDKPKEKPEVHRPVIIPTPCSEKLKEHQEKSQVDDGDKK